MRIISKFKDYYDCMQRYYSDELIYIRNETFEEFPGWNNSRYEGFNSIFGHFHSYEYTQSCEYRELEVGFCGKVYDCIEIKLRNTNDYSPVPTFFFYDADSVREFLAEKVDPKNWQRALKSFNKNKGHREFDAFFERAKSQQSAYRNLFYEKRVPIFVKYSMGVLYNACLKDIQFFKVFDTNTCFQELSMFLGGVLGNTNPPIPEISNNDMIEAKGFDLKYSFRKEKKK